MVKCTGCDAELTDGVACYRCEVETAQRGMCQHADHDCWGDCTNPAGCEALFVAVPPPAQRD